MSPWGRLPSEGPWLPAERIQEQVIVKAGLFGEIYTPLMGVASQKVRAALRDSHSIDRVPSVSKSESGTEVCGWLVFMGWVLSLAREWEEYSNYLGEGAGQGFPEFGCHQLSDLLWPAICLPVQEMQETQVRSLCCSHAFQETNSLRRTMQIVECSLLHRRAQGESPLSEGPRPAFVKIFYTPCVCV